MNREEQADVLGDGLPASVVEQKSESSGARWDVLPRRDLLLDDCLEARSPCGQRLRGISASEGQPDFVRNKSRKGGVESGVLRLPLQAYLLTGLGQLCFGDLELASVERIVHQGDATVQGELRRELAAQRVPQHFPSASFLFGLGLLFQRDERRALVGAQEVAKMRYVLMETGLLLGQVLVRLLDNG